MQSNRTMGITGAVFATALQIYLFVAETAFIDLDRTASLAAMRREESTKPHGHFPLVL